MRNYFKRTFINSKNGRHDFHFSLAETLDSKVDSTGNMMIESPIQLYHRPAYHL